MQSTLGRTGLQIWIVTCAKRWDRSDLQPAAGVLYAQTTNDYYYQYPSQLVFALYNVLMFFLLLITLSSTPCTQDISLNEEVYCCLH